VRVRLEGHDRFRLEVEDNGVGIGDDELPRLFQEFGQLPTGRKAGQGIGLGLALTRHIIEAQGGAVGVDSRLGRGSIFFAVLPLEGVGKTTTA
jgi:signal transduction histidine kinase